MSEPARSATVPAGPWVVVVGMHRSGTSVLTGMLGGLGLALPRPADRWEPKPSNPDHFESASMVNVNDRLLEALEGTWNSPPLLVPGWEDRPAARALDDEARQAASRAFPSEGPVVWKDPRASLLLPFWRRLLPDPLAGVLIWRAPEEVARSLQERDGLPMALGLAIWEHYNRAALGALAGGPAFVTSYDQLITDPTTLSRELAGWLDSLEWAGPWRGTWDLDRGTDVVSGDLYHQRAAVGPRLLEGQSELVKRLGALHGAHRSLPAVALPPPSPWVTALLEEHRHGVLAAKLSGSLDAELRAAKDDGARLRLHNRRLEEQVARLERQVAELEAAHEHLERQAREAARQATQAARALRALRASRSWRMTRPLRALSRASIHRDRR